MENGKIKWHLQQQYVDTFCGFSELNALSDSSNINTSLLSDHLPQATTSPKYRAGNNFWTFTGQDDHQIHSSLVIPHF